MFNSNYCFLTCMQISEESGKVIWYPRPLNNFPQFVLIHTVKGFSEFDKAELDVFWNCLAFSKIYRILTISSLILLPFGKVNGNPLEYTCLWFHGQRSLAGYSPWVTRVRHDLETKPPTDLSNSNLNIWKITAHVLLKPSLENFEHYFVSMWNECNCAIVWAFFGIAFPCD